MKKQYPFVLLIALSISVQSQIYEHKTSWNFSLANSNLSNVDFWNLAANPAVSVFLENSNIGIDVSNKFILKDLNSAMLLGNLKINKNQSLIFSISSYGNLYFNQNMFSMAYALSLHNNLSSAIEIDNHLNVINSNEYKELNYFPSVKLLLFYRLNESSSISTKYQYTKISAINSSGVIQNLCIGTSYSLNEQAEILYQISTSNLDKLSMSLGLILKFNDKISLQLGVKNNDLSANFGISLRFSTLRIVSSFYYQQYLGLSPSTSLQHTFNK